MCIKGGRRARCPRNHDNSVANECVNPNIREESCSAAGGTWTGFITNYLEKLTGGIHPLHHLEDMKLARGLPYKPHMISQGADQNEQFVVVPKPADVIFAPSTVVNHNGMNMEGKFSSYKWKVPCFPSNTTQRCVLRIRSATDFLFDYHYPRSLEPIICIAENHLKFII